MRNIGDDEGLWPWCRGQSEIEEKKTMTLRFNRLLRDDDRIEYKDLTDKGVSG